VDVPSKSAHSEPAPHILRFGVFELDRQAEQLLKNGRVVRLQPKPFKLLCLLAGQAGKLVTREDIQKALWSSDTFVDFEQGVNFAIKQVREALGEDADRPLYLQTVPKRGYRFVAPVDRVPADATAAEPAYRPATDGSLNKLLWTHIAELKLTESRRQKRRKIVIAVSAVTAVVLALIAAFLVLR
jgi:DNA-binding winged helix-turn-helix (wHTH) protein